MKTYLVTLRDNRDYFEKDVCVVSDSRQNIRTVVNTYHNGQSHTITFVEEIEPHEIPEGIFILSVSPADLGKEAVNFEEEKRKVERVKSEYKELKSTSIKFVVTLLILLGVSMLAGISLRSQLDDMTEKYEKQVQTTQMFHNYIKEKLPVSYEKDFGGNK